MNDLTYTLVWITSSGTGEELVTNAPVEMLAEILMALIDPASDHWPIGNLFEVSCQGEELGFIEVTLQ